MLQAEAKEDHRMGAYLAVLLLATSGVMLPMATFASTSVPGFALRFRAWSNGGSALMVTRTPGGQIAAGDGLQWAESSSARQAVLVALSGTTPETQTGQVPPPSGSFGFGGTFAVHAADGGQLVGAVQVSNTAGRAGSNPTALSAPSLGGFFAMQTGQTSVPSQGSPTTVSGQPGMFKAAETVFISSEMFLPFLQPSISPPMTSAVPKLWGDYFQRRSKFEIYVEILELMKRGPMTPFEVAFYGRLNHKRTKEYVEFLEENGYLQAVTEDDKTSYVLTREGAGFLEKFRALFLGTRFVEVPAFPYARDF